MNNSCRINSNPIIKHKAGLLNLASELQNVSKACKIMGVSRDTFYRYQELVETDGLEELINREHRVPNIKSCVEDDTEQAVIAYAVDFPVLGQHDWSAETSYRVLSILLESAKSLGNQYDPNAIVWCGSDAVPQLILLI